MPDDDLPTIDEIRRGRIEAYAAINETRECLAEFMCEYQNAISVPIEDAMALHGLARGLLDAVEEFAKAGNELADGVNRMRQRIEAKRA